MVTESPQLKGVMMTLRPGKASDSRTMVDAQRQVHLSRADLPAMQTLARGWLTGLAGLAAGILGFGVLHGRSDIGDLASPTAYAVGILLLLAAVAATAAAHQMLAAAHGIPTDTGTIVNRLQVGSLSEAVEQSERAMLSRRRLRRGLRWAGTAGLALLAAIALTWYGPAKGPLLVSVTEQSGGAWCGEVLSADGGTLRLKTDSGEVSVSLGGLATLQPVSACPIAPTRVP